MAKILVHFYKGTRIISRLIQWRTYSPFSHCSIQIGDDIYEAKEFIGVRKIKARIKAPKSLVETLEIQVTSKQLKTLIEYLESQLGNGYDYGAISGFLGLPKRDTTSKLVICSEYVYRALRKISIVLKVDFMLSPGNLYLLLKK